MAAPTATMPGQEAGRAQPQTTGEKPGGPFVRHTQPGNLSQYTQSGVAFGGTISNPLVARPGYYRNFRLLFTASGGVNGTTTVAGATDQPYNISSLIQFKDPFGTLIFSLPSFTGWLVHQHSGGAGCGLGSSALAANLPSWTAMSVGSSGTGNFQWTLTLPLEFSKGLGTSPGANASLQPTLNVQLNPSTSLYTTAPGTVPTVQLMVESDFYWLPNDENVAPPGLGTSRQWLYQQANPTIASGSNAKVAFPRLGGYLDTLILEIRDANNARVDCFPSQLNRLQLIIDGVPIEDSPWWKLQDDYFVTFRGNSRPSGVYVFSRKTSLNQQNEGLLDTGEATISSNPGTLFEVMGTPWGTISAAPATVNVTIGQIVPRGRMMQGLSQL